MSESTEQRKTIHGCLQQGVEAGCLILVTSDNQKYSLHGKSLPELGKGLGVDATGYEGDFDTCMEGTPFNVVSWTWNRQKCPV